VSAVPLVQRYRSHDPSVIVSMPGGDSTRFEGRLSFVDNAVDAASGTLMLKGEFANHEGALIPGQFVNVRLELYRDENAIVVPAVSVTRGQQGAFVYVLNPDSTVASRQVVVGRTVDEVAIVTHGLEAGETVITDGQLRLSPGARVVVRAPTP
jgi:multidrug efflux system membrane fusion protein